MLFEIKTESMGLMVLVENKLNRVSLRTEWEENRKLQEREFGGKPHYERGLRNAKGSS